MTTTYTGTIDENTITAATLTIGHAIEEAGEVGFVLTYHAAHTKGTLGRMALSGCGITQDQLKVLLANALAHNAETNATL